MVDEIRDFDTRFLAYAQDRAKANPTEGYHPSDSCNCALAQFVKSIYPDCYTSAAGYGMFKAGDMWLYPVASYDAAIAITGGKDEPLFTWAALAMTLAEKLGGDN